MIEIKSKYSIFAYKANNNDLFRCIVAPMPQNISKTLSQIGGKYKPVWKRSCELNVGDYIAQVIPKTINYVSEFSKDDARMYGLILGDGYCTSDESEWGISLNPIVDSHINFVKSYLANRNIHYWIDNRNCTSIQIKWSVGIGSERDIKSGRFKNKSLYSMPFNYEDIYCNKKKHISDRFSNLPQDQTVSLIHGLIESDGTISNGRSIVFTNTSNALISGIRHQLLRMKIPTSGQYRERVMNHSGTRSDGTKIFFNGICKSTDVRIPAVKELADIFGIKPLEKFNWFEYDDRIWSRVKYCDITSEQSSINEELYDVRVFEN